MKKPLLASLTAAGLIAVAALSGAVPAHATARTVVVWSPFRGANLDMWNASIQRIENANPGLNIESVGRMDMEQSLAAINAGTGPDISVSNGVGNVGWFCGTGAWKSLNVLVQGGNGINLSKTFTPTSIRSTQSNGVRCALPYSSEVFGFYYNKTMLSAAGFSNAPRTTAELLKAAKRLTKFKANGDIAVAGYVPWTGGDYDNGMGSLFLGQMFGATWYTGNKAAFATDPKWVKAFTWQKQFIADVYGGGDFNTGKRKLEKFTLTAGDFWGTNNDFITGRVAMIAHADWMSMMFCDPEGWNLVPCTKPAVNFGTAPLPVDTALYPKYYGSGIVGSNAMGISKGSTNVADAWIVLKGLATDKTLAIDWANANGDPSSLLAARPSAKPAGLVYPSFYQAFYAISNNKYSNYHAVLNTGEHQDEVLMQEFMAAWQSGSVSNLKSGLKNVATQVNQIIARNA